MSGLLFIRIERSEHVIVYHVKIESLFTSLINLLGTNRICTIDYQPETNGMIKYFHHSLKVSLKAK